MKKINLFLITIASISMFVFSTQAMKRGSFKPSKPLLALKRRVAKELGLDYARKLRDSVEANSPGVRLGVPEATGDAKLVEDLRLLKLFRDKKFPRGDGPVSRRGRNPRRRLNFGQLKKNQNDVINNYTL